MESRLGSLSIDTNDLSKLGQETEAYTKSSASTTMPSAFSYNMIADLIPLFNVLNVRRAILPAANGHFSARAVARYYATLVDGGVVPPRHPTSNGSTNDEVDPKIFTNTKEKIHDAFLGRGDFKDLTFPNGCGLFELGFQGFKTTDGSVIGFGHTGLGESTG